MPVLFEEAGGILEPEKMVAAHVDVARYHGATVHTGEQVSSSETVRLALLAVAGGTHRVLAVFAVAAATAAMTHPSPCSTACSWGCENQCHVHELAVRCCLPEFCICTRRCWAGARCQTAASR